MNFDAEEFVLNFQNAGNDKDFLEFLPHATVITCLDLYRDTGNFTALIFAYHICRKSKTTPPEELLLLIDKHHDRFLKAKTKDDGLAALGFDSNKKGGIWQVPAFWGQLMKKMIRFNIELMLLVKPQMKKIEAFKFLAEMTQKITGSKSFLSISNIKRMFNEKS